MLNLSSIESLYLTIMFLINLSLGVINANLIDLQVILHESFVFYPTKCGAKFYQDIFETRQSTQSS